MRGRDEVPRDREDGERVSLDLRQAMAHVTAADDFLAVACDAVDDGDEHVAPRTDLVAAARDLV